MNKPCLKCNQEFDPKSKFNRICPQCYSSRVFDSPPEKMYTISSILSLTGRIIRKSIDNTSTRG